ncbi:hypothetical protein F0919_17955 [Taibaiella lutea]|uniref:Uncharacterized protein n=1 Tax=Taibaiella lutea TaxID=2608001 RepID=A0A5M6CC11_9BACT|nr:hypothetical protein [Taibaiella lutea]KAA5532666.1 hypothetical protein F0919_17955 [Taibaiella lutea]
MMKAPPRSTKVEFERRLLAVQAWLIEGNTHAMVLKNIIDQKWSNSKRHAEKMIQLARERWIDFEDESLDKKRKFKIQELKHMKRSLAQEYRTTPEGIKALLSIEKEIIKLEGLSIKKIEISGDEEKPLQVKHIPSDVDYTKLSNEVLEKIVLARKPREDE